MSDAFSSCSVKQLKAVMISLSNDIPELRSDSLRGLDREELNALARKHIQEDELPKLLKALEDEASSVKESKPEEMKSATKPTTSSSSSAPPDVTPEQLRMQARYMKENPAAVRSAQPMFSSWSDAKIREYATNLEKMADNPELLAEATKMNNLESEDREIVQLLQGGIMGQVPTDDAWVNRVVSAIKTKPDMFVSLVTNMIRTAKMQFPEGVDEQNIVAFVRGMSTWEESSLRMTINGILLLSSLFSKLKSAYEALDKASGGMGKQIVSLVVLAMVLFGFWVSYRIVCMVLAWISSFIFGSAQSTVVPDAQDDIIFTSPPPVLPQVPTSDEFAEL